VSADVDGQREATARRAYPLATTEVAARISPVRTVTSLKTRGAGDLVGAWHLRAKRPSTGGLEQTGGTQWPNSFPV
jgi:hypothetical protein